MTAFGLDRPAPRVLLRRLAAPARLVALGLALGALGPFGSYLGMGLPVRLVHFTVTVLSIGLMVRLAQALIARCLPAGAPALGTAAAAALLTAPAGASLVQWHLSLWAPAVLPFVTWAELAVQTALISLAVAALSWVLERRAAAAVPVSAAPARPAAAPAPASSEAGLRRRLPSGLRAARILALSAEDHYLRVRTDRGEALILMSLSEAAAAMAAGAGLRIHRSHWVAAGTLAGRCRRAGRPAVRLADGTVLPVSRAGLKAAREAGFWAD